MKKLIGLMLLIISIVGFGAEEGLEKGDLFPKIDLYNTEGEFVGTSLEHRGKITIYNFGASWCPPCKIEKPMLNDFYNENIEEVNAVSIMLDQTPRAVDEFYAENPMDFPHYFDLGSALGRKFLIRAVPTSYIVNEDGVNLARISGAIDWTKITVEDIRELEK